MASNGVCPFAIVFDRGLLSAVARRPEPAATIIAAQDEAVFGLEGIDLFCITVTFIPNVYDFVHWILDVTTQELSNCLHNL